MSSELYVKLLQDVEELLLSRPYGDIAMGYVKLQLYGLQDEQDRIRHLRNILRNKDGTAQKLGERTAESVEEIKRHTETLESGEGTELS